MEFLDYKKMWEQQRKEIERLKEIAEFFEQTLRDQFAMSALQGLMAAKFGDYGYRTLAEYSYKMADAMMEARKASAAGSLLFKAQAVHLSRVGNDVTITCDSVEDTDNLYDWLENLCR